MGMMTMKKVCLLGILALSLMGISCSDDHPSSWPNREFNAAEWSKTPAYERYVFANDLRDHKLIGLERQQVARMLGPDGSGTTKLNPMCYVIKETDAVRTMCVHFDARDKVSDVEFGWD